MKDEKPGAIIPAAANEFWQGEMAREYLTSVFQPLAYYSVPVSKETMMENGELAVTTSHFIFQIVKMQTGRSRTKVLHTVLSTSDKSVVSKLALQIQTLTEVQDIDGQKHVVADDDPHWVESTDLAPFGTISRDMVQWQPVLPSESHVGCQALSDSIRALPKYAALTDASAPTVSVLRDLRRQGWQQNPAGRTVHDRTSLENNTRLCDSRGGVSIKFYVQCLLDLPKSLSLTPTLPSNECQAFFKCILSGYATVPGLGAEHYLDLLSRKGSVELPALADVPHEDSLPAMEDEEDVIVASSGSTVVPASVAPKLKAKAVPSAAKAFLALPPAPPSVEVAVLPPASAVAGSAASSWSGVHHPGEPADDIIIAGGAASGSMDDDDIIAAGAHPVSAGHASERVWIPAIGGIGVITCQSYTPSGGGGYVNWILEWEMGGKKWEKRNVAPKACENFGSVEPVAYLHAFRDAVCNGSVSSARSSIPHSIVDS